MIEKAEYFWNNEFIELIHKDICPYCGDELIVKGLTHECACGFYLTGACETLAYSRISPKAPTHNYNYNTDNTSLICDECGCTELIKDTTHGELICSECGLVVQGPPSYSGYVRISYDNFKGSQ